MATEVGKLYYDLEIDDSKLKSGLDSADKSVSRTATSATNNFKDFAKNTGQAFNNVADSIGNFAKKASLLLIGGGIGLGVFVKEASELQSVKASFESMTGSAEDASDVLSQLNEFSFKTAFSSKDINSAARLLLGAGIATQDLGKRMQTIGDIAGATGADLGRLTLPLSQALSRGKLQTQDFYQIIDSGAGALGQALKKKLADKGMGDFTKAMEQGLVTSDILIETMNEVASQGGFAFEGAAKQADTFAGRVSNLKEQVSNTVLELLGVNKATGEVDPNGTFAKMSDAVKDATEWLKENKEEIKNVGKFLQENLIPAIGGVAAAFTTAKIAAILFWLATASGPMLIAAGIAAAIGGLVYLYMKYEWFRNAVNGVFNFIKENWQLMLVVMTGGLGLFIVGIINHWDKVKEVVGAAIDFIKNNWQLLIFILTGGIGWLVMKIIQNFDTIKEVAGRVKDAIVGAFKWAWDKVTGLWNGITGFFGKVGEGIGNAISGALEGVKNTVKAAVNWIIDKANVAIRGVNKVSPPGVPEIGEIPKLSKGIENFGGGLAYVHRGEVLTNLAPGSSVIKKSDVQGMMNAAGGGGGDTYNFNFSGMAATSKQSLRDMSQEIFNAFNEGLRSQGKKEVGTW